LSLKAIEVFVSKGRSYTCALSGTVGAGPGVGLTLVVGPISFPYKIKGAEIVFRDDTTSLLQIYLLSSRDTTTSAGGPPADTNLFAPFGPTVFLIGEALVKRVAVDYTPDPDQKYIKVHALNNCTYAQTVNVTVEIEAV
jgi:hypothetical protein